MSRQRRTMPPPGPSVLPASSDPLAGVERVMIDGSNLAYAIGRGAGMSRSGNAAAGPAPLGAVIGRLRAAFPPSVSMELVFDGPSSGGLRGRLATGLNVAYSGRASADSLIVEGVAAQLAVDGPAGTWGILVVTDDRGLRDLVQAKGARVAGTAWLAASVGRITPDTPRATVRGPGERSRPRPAQPSAPLPRAGTSIGHRRPPRAPGSSGRDDD